MGKRQREEGTPVDEDSQIDHDLQTLNNISSAVRNNTTIESDELSTPSPRKKRALTAGRGMSQYDTLNANERGEADITALGAEAGFIKKVVLQNFMCHENFHMELGPGLNFIVGNNGSGKSAILTAITICLGAKANTTNRGSSLKDLIRTGCNQSKIQVILNNEGTNAFEPEKYGKEIIIERVMKVDGFTQYKIKSDNTKVVSTKKKTLDTIVDFFSIPVTNPMCFLSQDAARSFLTASTPGDKYSHFMKGTLIEETAENHQLIIKKIDSIRNTLQLHQEHVRNLLKDHNAAKSLYQSMRSNVDLLEKKRNLQGKLIWLNVEANENVKTQLLTRTSKYKEKISECEKDIDEKNDLIVKINEKADQVQTELAEIQSTLDEKNLTTSNWYKELNELISRARVEEHNVGIANKDLENSKKIMTKTSRIYSDKKLQNERASDENQKAQRVQLEKLEEKLAEWEKENSKIDSELTRFEDEKVSLKEKYLSLRNNLTQSIEGNKHELSLISSAKNDVYGAFHARMKQALNTIAQMVSQRQFKEAPIGPLGLHVSIKEEFANAWSKPVQNVLNKSLRSFVVSNIADEKTLKTVLRQFGIETQIINRKMKSFDYTVDSPNMNYPTIADALTFDIKEIECTFVDLNSIHNTALIEDRNEARNVLKSGVRNLRMVLSIKDENSMFRSSARGSGFSVDTINNLSPVITMKEVAQQDYGAYYRSKVTEAEAELNEHTQKYRTDMKAADLEISSRKDSKRSLFNKRRSLQEKKTSIEIELNKVVDAGDLELLLQQIETQKETISINERTINDLHEKIAKINVEIDPIQQSYVAAKKDNEASSKLYNRKKEGLNEIARLVSDYQDDISADKRNITAIENRIKQYDTELTNMESGIERIVQAAEAHCSREVANMLEIGNDKQEVEAELTKIDKRIKSSEKTLGMSHKEGRELYEQTKQKFDVARKRVHELEEGVDLLATSVQERLDALSIALKSTCLNADVDFKRSLRFRDFTGSLDFDNEKKNLRVFVQTRNDVTARDVDTLSGGEKSYSQISLLLATWKPMKSRIIALDEFDVFMDQVNRTIGTRLIMFKLSTNLRMQTIIITPQDISKIANMEDHKNVQIRRMNDPQRANNSNFFVAS